MFVCLSRSHGLSVRIGRSVGLSVRVVRSVRHVAKAEMKCINRQSCVVTNIHTHTLLGTMRVDTDRDITDKSMADELMYIPND